MAEDVHRNRQRAFERYMREGDGVFLRAGQVTLNQLCDVFIAGCDYEAKRLAASRARRVMKTGYGVSPKEE